MGLNHILRIDGRYICCVVVVVVSYHHDPGDKVELFDDVEKVEGEQNSSNPKTTHGAEIEPIGSRVVIVFRNHDANEAQYIQQLKQKREDEKKMLNIPL